MFLTIDKIAKKSKNKNRWLETKKNILLNNRAYIYQQHTYTRTYTCIQHKKISIFISSLSSSSSSWMCVKYTSHNIWVVCEKKFSSAPCINNKKIHTHRYIHTCMNNNNTGENIVQYSMSCNTSPTITIRSQNGGDINF